MIYAALAFLMVLCAALGGILYAKGNENADLKNAIQTLARTSEAQAAEIKVQRLELSDISLGVANLNVSSDLKSRLLALERKQTDSSAPRQVRGINEARRMAQSMGGVEGIKVQ